MIATVKDLDASTPTEEVPPVSPVGPTTLLPLLAVLQVEAEEVHPSFFNLLLFNYNSVRSKGLELRFLTAQ